MSFVKRFQKSFLSLFLIAAALVGGTGLSTVLFQSEGSAAGADGSSTGPVFSFMSISDIHDDTSKLAMALQDSVANKVDAITVVGDLTNSQTEAEYDLVMNTMNTTEHAPAYYTIGNHEYDYESDFSISRNRFIKKTKMPDLYYDKWIKDYHFIFLGAESRPATITDEQISWLDSKLAENADPSKPVFVFLHQPLDSTVSKSYPSDSYIGVDFLQQQKIKNVLAKYPQSIFVTGHIHDDIKLEGNLYSDKFSAVRDGAVTAGQDLIFEVYNDKVTMRGRDIASATTIWNGTTQLRPNTTGMYEAEEGVFSYATLSDDVNASSSKGVNMNDTRAYMEMLKVDGGATGGNKILKIRYAADSANVSKGLYVNGDKKQTLSFPTTGGMSSYNDLAVAIELKPGNNKIAIKSDGNATRMNLDKLQIVEDADYSTMWGFNSNGNDSVPSGFNTTLKGSAAYNTADKMEGSASLSLNGSNGNYASASLISTKTDDVTLTSWVKWNGATSESQQILTNGDGLTNGYSIVLDHSKGDKVSIAVDGTTILGSQTALTVGQWTNVTAARRSGAWELYVNGSSVPVNNNTAAPSSPTTGTYLGADSSGRQSFKGLIDAVRFYNKALSTDQIKAFANETSDITVQSIAITNLPTKRIYSLGERLDLSGITVVGTYSDGSTKNVNVNGNNISGFNAGSQEMGQTLTVNVGGKATTFTVDIYTVKPGSTSVPGRIQAKDYNEMFGIDQLGSDYITYTNTGDWVDYNVNVASTGTYQVDYNIGGNSNGGIDFIVDGVLQKTTTLPSTGGWTSWANRSDTVSLTAGTHTIRLRINPEGYNLRSFELTQIVDKNLTSITSPAAVTGLANGTAKTVAALGLPAKVVLVTSGGNVDASVTWDVSGTSYDPKVETGQTFTVTGTVTLPVGVVNPNNVPLTTSISVTVNPITSIPGKIEAENYVSMSGIQTENSSEGTKDVGYTDPGDWMDYVVNVQKSALYKVDYRVAVNSGTGIVNLLVDNVSNKITSFPSTGGFQVWKTVSDKVYLSAGKHTIRLAINTGGFNLNWFELSEVPPTNLTSITAQAAITGVDIGTAKTVAALGLPVNTVLVTDSGNVDASVIWDLSGISYDPTTKTVQTFTVPGTVTLPSGVVNPNNLPLTTSVSVTINKIPSSQMTATATSQETAGENDAASMAIDGKPGTYWHTKWNKSDVLPQSITINLGGTYNINSILYLPRQSGSNGIITSYNVYASTDGVSFTKVANGNWANDNTKKIATFASTNASYVKLEATAGVNGYASAAEIGVTVEPSVVPNLMTITAPAAITGVVSGTAKTAAALGLPSTVELVTDKGSMNAVVTWNVDASSYDPAVQTQQTFSVNGTVTLPAGVVNPNNVALTTSVSVTVLSAPAKPKSTLIGVQQVLSGQTFTLTMGLADVTQSVYQQVYAQEFTLQYDPASVKFDSVTSLKDGFRVIDTKETAPGQLRIVAASVGVNVPAEGDLIAIKFTAKSVSQATNTTISVDHVMIANAVGNELQVGGASREIQITVPSIPVDKSFLNATIANAQTKYTAAVEGDGDGLYAIGSKAQLQSAIDAAKDAVNNSNATQQQVDSAKAALEAAVQLFERKLINADINGNGISIGDLALVAGVYGKEQGQVGWNEKADVNHDGKVDIVDLAIVAKAILH